MCRSWRRLGAVWVSGGSGWRRAARLIFSLLHCLFLVDIFHEWALFSKANAFMVK